MLENELIAKYSQWIEDQSARFTSIGATYAIDKTGNIYEPENGIAVSDGIAQWIVTLDTGTKEELTDIFRKIAHIADLSRSVLSGDNDRIYGVWLDLESSPVSYMIESGRLFHDLDRAFDYANKYGQRYMFDIAIGNTIAVIGNVIDGSTGDDFLIDLEKVQ